MIEATISHADGIQGVFRMGEILQKKGDKQLAIEKYKQVIYDSEKIVALNPDSNFELRWTALALGNISDIYESDENWTKALAYRNLQNEFLTAMTKKQKRSHDDDEEEDMDEVFVQITTSGSMFRTLFKKAHKVLEMEDVQKGDTAEEMLQKLNAQIKKEQDEEYNNAIKRLQKMVKENEERSKRPLIVKMKDWVHEHPYLFLMFLLLSLFFAGIVVRLININRLDPKILRRYRNLNREFNQHMAEFAKNHKDL